MVEARFRYATVRTWKEDGELFFEVRDLKDWSGFTMRFKDHEFDEFMKYLLHELLIGILKTDPIIRYLDNYRTKP